MKKTLLSSILGTVLLLPTAQATELTYDYIGVGYTKLSVDDSIIDFDGYVIDGSKLLTDRVFVILSYASTSGDTNLNSQKMSYDLNETRVGLGYRFPMADKTDLYGELGYINRDAKVALTINGTGLSSKDSFDAATFRLGVKHLLGQSFETDFYVYNEKSSSEGSMTTFGVNVAYRLTKQFHLVAGFEMDSDYKRHQVGLQYAF